LENVNRKLSPLINQKEAAHRRFFLSNPPAEYPAACCGDESGLFPLPWEGKLKMGWGQETAKTIKIG
jgi:hypothetical protein